MAMMMLMMMMTMVETIIMNSIALCLTYTRLKKSMK